MATVTVRNLPDEVHRALRIIAAQHGRSTEAEIRHILEKASISANRIKLGTLLSSIAHDAGGLSEDEAEHINQLRNTAAALPMSFE